MDTTEKRSYRVAGERNPQSKLTYAQALEIRNRARAGERQYDLAAEFTIDKSVVSNIMRGKRWASLPDDGWTPPDPQFCAAGTHPRTDGQRCKPCDAERARASRQTYRHSNPLPLPTLAERLAKGAIRQANGCLDRPTKGYGSLQVIGDDGKRHTKGAHVIAWELANDQLVPPGMLVRHTCDRPPCIEPTHLLLGTQVDNVKDRNQRGRTYRRTGPKNKLSTEQVRAIRRRAAAGESTGALALEYRVSAAAISSIKYGRTWRSIS